MITCRENLALFTGLVFALGLTTQLLALPPLGLTQVLSTPDPYQGVVERRARIAAIDGVVYVSTHEGIYPVDASGLGALIQPVAAGAANLFNTTRVVMVPGDELYFGANFSGFDGGPRIYPLGDPTNPVVAWSTNTSIYGIDSSLRAVGRASFPADPSIGSESIAAVLLADGTVVPANDPPTYTIPNDEPYFIEAVDVSPSGVAIGPSAQPSDAPLIPEATGLLYPDGRVEVLETLFGGFGDIADRADGKGLNVGYFDDINGPTIRYGDTEVIIDPGAFQPGYPLVSESNFAVIGTSQAANRPLLAFYPGIDSDGPNLPVELIGLFPELATIEFEYVLDVASYDNQVHLLVSGDDGLWLFTGLDPSVVPEPSCLTWLGVFGAFVALRRGGRYPNELCGRAVS